MNRLYLLTLLLCSAAQATTLVELRPAGPVSGAYRWQCAATGFADDGSIVGACIERYYRAGSGRGGGYLPPVVLGTWLTTWDRSGNPTLSANPAAWPGCQGTQSVVMVNGQPMYFISADSMGDELVENNCASWLATP